jgi:hypothetical protein
MYFNNSCVQMNFYCSFSSLIEVISYTDNISGLRNHLSCLYYVTYTASS